MVEVIDKFGKWEVTAGEKCDIRVLIEPSQFYKDVTKPHIPVKQLDTDKLMAKLIAKGVISSKDEVETTEVI